MIVGKDTRQIKCVECGFEGEAKVYDYGNKKIYSIEKYFTKNISRDGRYNWPKPRRTQYI